MTPSGNTGHGLQAEILKAARRGQEVVSQAIKTSAGKVRSVTAPGHELKLPFADKLPKPEQVAGNLRGVAARLPKPDDLAKRLPKLDELAGNVRGMTARLPKPEELAGTARNAAARLPKPEELAASAGSLATRLLASQRKFADQVLRVTTPQLPGQSRPAEGGAARPGGTPSQDGDHGTAEDSGSDSE